MEFPPVYVNALCVYGASISYVHKGVKMDWEIISESPVLLIYFDRNYDDRCTVRDRFMTQFGML